MTAAAGWARFLQWSRAHRTLVWLSLPLIVTYPIGFAAYSHEQHIASSWVGPVTLAGILTEAWVDGRFDRRRAASLVGILTAVCWLMTLPFGFAFWEGVRISVVDVLASLVLVATYRWLSRGRGWFPQRHQDVLALTRASILAALVMVVFGGVPDWSPELSLQYVAWWVVRIQINLAIGCQVLFSLWFAPRPMYSRVRYVRWLPVAIPLSLACLCLPYLIPQYPLDWLLLLPALWIGLCLTPRLGALAVVGIAVVPAVVGRSTVSTRATDGWLPPTLSMEVVCTVAATLAFLFLAFRENSARLTAHVEEAARRDAAQQSLILSVIQSMTDGVLLTDERGAIRLSNPAARAMLGHPDPSRAGELGWAGEFGLRSRDGTVLQRDHVADLLDPPTDGFAQLTVSLPGEGGDADRFYLLSSRCLHLRRERLNLVVISDVTWDHGRRRELEAFAGTVAHDLKNPLAALALWMDVAETELDEDPQAGRHALDQARESSRRMGHMIDEYLAYTVTREGMLRPEQVDLASLVREVVAVYGAGEQVPEVEIRVDAVVQADRALVTQLLANLVGNSVKYARPGTTPYLRIRTARGEHPGWVRVLVEDRGVGLGEGDPEDLFAPFTRSATGVVTGQGIGLGLALCRAIVARHRGRITARNNAWGGTTVEFTLPAVGTDVELDDEPTTAPILVTSGTGRR